MVTVPQMCFGLRGLLSHHAELTCLLDAVGVDVGDCQCCFCCFYVGSRIVVGMRCLMSSYGTLMVVR